MLQFLVTEGCGVDHGSKGLTKGGRHDLQEKRSKNGEGKGRKDCRVDLNVPETMSGGMVTVVLR